MNYSQQQPTVYGQSPISYGQSQPITYGQSQPMAYGQLQPQVINFSQPQTINYEQPLTNYSQPQPDIYEQPKPIIAHNHPSSPMANQVMPTREPNDFAYTVQTRLNQIRNLDGFVGKGSGGKEFDDPRTTAANQLPNSYPIPLRFLVRSAPFQCKNCGHKGYTRVEPDTQLSCKGKTSRCIMMFIPMPPCLCYGWCGLCPGTCCHELFCDRRHVCPKCEYEVAKWLFWSAAKEVTIEEVAEALERMEKEKKYGRYF